MIAIGLVALLCGIAAKTGPRVLRSLVIEAAARRGFLVSVVDLAPRSSGLALLGVRATLASVDECVFQASEVDIGLDWQGNVRNISAPGYELLVRGDASSLGTSLARWRNAPHAHTKLEATAGHLSWVDALARGIVVDGIGMSLSLGELADDSLRVDVPSFTVTLPKAALGPWHGRLEASAEETKGMIGLDRAKPDGVPSIGLVSRAQLGTVLSASIPRANVTQLGIPADLLHLGPSPEVGLAFEAQALPTGEPITAHAKLELHAPLPAVKGAAVMPIDLVMEGEASGDTAEPLPIASGLLAVGPVKTRLTGKVTVSQDGVRIEVDRPPTKAAKPLPPYVFDTREWTHRNDEANPATAAVKTASVPGAKK